MTSIGKDSNDIPFEAIANRQILVVDDAKSLRDVIASILRKAGFNNIQQAENGQEAMLKVAANPPDIIILDLMMPIMDGMKVCRLVREIEDTASIPIIIQTAMNDNEERLKAFAAGASDLVTKPINALELVIRTKLHLKNLILTEKREKYRIRVADELSTAKDVQQNILPSQKYLDDIRSKTGLHISSMCQPSSELGGDFWGVHILKNGSVGFYVTDFSGHGVVAALNTIRLHTLLFNVGEAWQKPSALLSKINQSLCDMLPTGQYATMIIGLICPEKKMLSYAGAAAPPPIYGEWSKPAELQYLDTTGLPLGISKSATYDLKTIPFTPDHFLFSFSDALVETKLNDGTLLEGDELIEWVKDLTNAQPNPQLLDQLIMAFFENGGDDLRDDLTAISFDYL
ncbi:PP2C family protein-serine/threonine phosphatase [Kiloniella sp. EL199]|uniref:PP2C family protein-serine/threonine phosphatase n=1 Tax=Kiloniella sp. EL199 TaxID=2107581 RepID=UPI000EA163D3|nr:SpoIIE family protein phosphatase [Kiloniella sp. EL199]